jgi:integrase
MYSELRETLSPRTVRYVHAILHNALKEAVRSRRVVRNVAEAARPPRAKDTRAREMTTWTAGDVARFFALDDVEANRDRVAWWVAVTTGVRRGELLGLRWSDIDLDRGRVTVAQTCTAVDHEIVITPGTKTGKGRTLDVDETTVAELRAHRARRAQEMLALGIRPGDTSLVFARPDGTPFDPDRFSERFIRLVERHPELPRIRLHDLRHTHATMLLRAGVPITVVSKRIGHSSIAITGDVYQHVDSGMQADAAQRGVALILDAVVTNL